jgi:NAD(P)-dependent dehydrogenase (short-subunit alcohol dehydrogenase family)
MQIKNSVALVTRANRGIGRALVEVLLQRGASRAKRGITVHGVFPGRVDTDMARPFEMPKTPAIDVAHATLDGVEAGEEDIFPDPMSRQLYSAWRQDRKSVERHFATI